MMPSLSDSTFTVVCNSSVHQLWCSANAMKMSSQIHNLWMAAILCGFHIIWSARNQRIFKGIRPNLTKWIEYLKIWLLDVSKFANDHMHNNVSDLLIIKKFGIECHPPKAPQITDVYWLPPPPGWIKINTDGLSHKDPLVAAAGGVFRDGLGTVLGAFCCSIGPHTAFYEEMMALIQGIQIAQSKGWTKILLEIDSLAVLTCLLNHNFKPPWPIAVQWS